MPASPLLRRSSNKAAALIIVLAFVVLLTGLALAYFSRTTTERQLAQPSYNDTSSDLLARSALDVIVSDLQQEIVNGSISPAPIFSCSPSPCASYVYTPTTAANMVPPRSGNAAGVPNLIRRSVRSDPILPPGLSSLASEVNSTTDASANGRSVTLARWNTHYLLPKGNTGNDDSYPASPLGTPFNPYTPNPNGFTPPDWVFVTGQGPTVITSLPNTSVVGRYAYAVYDEGGLLDMNVAGYPTGTTVSQSGRKGSLAYADLTPTSGVNLPQTQVDNIVGWRNYASTQQTGSFGNFSFTAAQALLYFNSVINNTNGFLTASTPPPWNNRTDQVFVQRQELVDFRKAVGSPTSFSANALQYLGTFSRETNAPSFSPSTPAGSTIDYATLANTDPAAINPNFLLRRVTTSFKRFDGITTVVGEPLVKTRFPLSRLAWITYKGPSQPLVGHDLDPNIVTPATSDPIITNLVNNFGVSVAMLEAGTAANIKACFGLTFPTGGSAGSPWTYTNPTGTSAASAIMRLDQVAAAARDPDFFELLQAGILSGSLGQNTAPPPGTSGGGTTGGNVFPDVHMSSTMQHLLTIGAGIIDQADPDSIPTRIQFTDTNGNTWTAYGVENLPYITQMYPIAGTSPDTSSKWATYLLFQLWNPHQNAAGSTPAVRLRVDGAIGLFRGGNGESWTPGNPPQIIANGNSTGQSVILSSAYSFSAPAPLTNVDTTNATPAPGPPAGGAFAILPAIP